jgi:hypothetical protein
MPVQMNAKSMLSTAWNIVEGAPTCVENAQLPVRRWQLWGINGSYFIIKAGQGLRFFCPGTTVVAFGCLVFCSSMFVC